jgi:phosphate starvation-inducible membrane PsiE
MRFPVLACISCTITYLITFIAVPHSEEIDIVTLTVKKKEADP